MDLRDAPTVMAQLPAAFEHFNEVHPHSSLKMRSTDKLARGQVAERVMRAVVVVVVLSGSQFFACIVQRDELVDIEELVGHAPIEGLDQAIIRGLSGAGGVRPGRTSSTICCLHSAGCGGLTLDLCDSLNTKNDVSAEPGQLQSTAAQHPRTPSPVNWPCTRCTGLHCFSPSRGIQFPWPAHPKPS